MKRTLLWSFVALMLLGLLAPAVLAQEPPLGDVARKARRQKPAPSPGERVYDNDNLPGKGTISTVGPASDTANQTQATDDANKDKNATASADEHKKANDQWAGKIATQKEEISRLERELNVAQRESKIHAAVNYADVGSRLANNAKFAQQERQDQDEISAKQKQLDDAKQKLTDMQEEARKAGVPASQRD